MLKKKDKSGNYVNFNGRVYRNIFNQINIILDVRTMNLIKQVLEDRIKLLKSDFVARDVVWGDWTTVNNGKFIPLQIIYEIFRYENYKSGITNSARLSQKSAREAGLIIGYFIREILSNDQTTTYVCECEPYLGYRYRILTQPNPTQPQY